MYCHNCGHKAKDEDRFCTECGTILNNSSERKTIKITCEDCGGVMEVDSNKTILTCPYCGSKKLITESDEVTIARINKEADSERMRYDKEKREYEEELRVKKDKEDWKSIGILWIIVIVMFIFFINIDKFF